MEAGSSCHGSTNETLAEALLPATSPDERDASAARSVIVHNISVLKLSVDTEEESPSISDRILAALSTSWGNLCSQPLSHLSNALEAGIPCLKTLRAYSLTDLQGDFLAGITVGVMLIPQSMAYGKQTEGRHASAHNPCFQYFLLWIMVH
jgi:hypothetical protein